MSSDEAPIKAPHPSVFLILLAPFGISSGYVGVTLTYLLGAHGLTAVAIGGLVFWSTFPQAWKVLWAPVVDTTLTAKKWFLIGALAVGASLIAMSVIPSPTKAMLLLTVLAAVSSIASTLTSMASETFLANIDPRLQGRASGWAQAGNFSGAGLGGGIGLWLATHVHAQWVSGGVLGLICMACAIPLLFMIETDRTHVRPTMRETFAEVAIDVWSVVRKRAGLLVVLLMLLPIGSGGASTVMTAKAGEWRVSADLVAFVGGWMGGIVSGVAAVLAGYFVDRMDRRTAYCLFGAVIAIVLGFTAYAPRTPMVWVISSLAYGAVIAMTYSAYSAVVLEAIGKGAAATKFNLMASAANVPVSYMVLVDTHLHDSFGTNWMFFGESALSIASGLVFALLVVATRRWRPATAADAALP